jgi:hypothetical protein
MIYSQSRPSVAHGRPGISTPCEAFIYFHHCALTLTQMLQTAGLPIPLMQARTLPYKSLADMSRVDQHMDDRELNDPGRSFLVAGLDLCLAWVSLIQFVFGVALTNPLFDSYGIVAPFIVLNARPGAIQHITFPVVARTSFGLWGSLWCTFNRGAMAW